MLGVLLHIIGDAINNIGVIIVALVLWKSKSDARFYADPAISLFIAIMIFASAFPLVKGAGSILLEAAPLGIDMEDIKRDLEKASYIPRQPWTQCLLFTIRFLASTLFMNFTSGASTNTNPLHQPTWLSRTKACTSLPRLLSSSRRAFAHMAFIQ